MIATIIIIAIWLALSPFIGWLWGRFVRVGMVELQKERQDLLGKRTVTVPKPTRYYHASRSHTEDKETPP